MAHHSRQHSQGSTATGSFYRNTAPMVQHGGASAPTLVSSHPGTLAPSGALPQPMMAIEGWRTETLRPEREYWIKHLYNELLRATGEPPGPKLWITAANFELSLFRTSPSREYYIAALGSKLYCLSKQPSQIDALTQHIQSHQPRGVTAHGCVSPFPLSQGPPLVTPPSRLHHPGSVAGGNGGYPLQPHPSMSVPHPSTSSGPPSYPFHPSMVESRTTNGYPYQTPGGMIPASGVTSRQHANMPSTVPTVVSAPPLRNEGAIKLYWTEFAKLKAKYWPETQNLYKKMRQAIEQGGNPSMEYFFNSLNQVVYFFGEKPSTHPSKTQKELDQMETMILKLLGPLRRGEDKGVKVEKSNNGQHLGSVPPTVSSLPTGGVTYAPSPTENSKPMNHFVPNGGPYAASAMKQTSDFDSLTSNTFYQTTAPPSQIKNENTPVLCMPGHHSSASSATSFDTLAATVPLNLPDKTSSPSSLLTLVETL